MSLCCEAQSSSLSLWALMENSHHLATQPPSPQIQIWRICGACTWTRRRWGQAGWLHSQRLPGHPHSLHLLAWLLHLDFPSILVGHWHQEDGTPLCGLCQLEPLGLTLDFEFLHCSVSSCVLTPLCPQQVGSSYLLKTSRRSQEATKLKCLMHPLRDVECKTAYTKVVEGDSPNLFSLSYMKLSCGLCCNKRLVFHSLRVLQGGS